MRKLTIQREKRFVACLATMKVYIEDPTANDLTINGCSCRKLGTLKNGQKKTFHISEDAAKVFVIADRLSKGFCNEYYPLAAGQEDIVLTGRNCFNPANGNAFRFDGINDAGVMENRKKSTNKGLLILVIALVVGITVGGLVGGTIVGVRVFKEILSSAYGPKEFKAGDLRITLTGEFKETKVDGHTAFASDDAVVIVQSEMRQLLESSGIRSVKAYAEAVRKANGHTAAIYSDENFLYYEYMGTNSITGEQVHNLLMFRANTTDFYMVQFSVPEDKWNQMQETVMEWARSVTVY